MCITCFGSSAIGGFFASLMGIDAPKTTKGRIFSGASTVALTVITAIAMKILFGVPLCGGEGLTLKNIIVMGVKSLVIGIPYSIGVNYLIKRFKLFEPNENVPPPPPPPAPKKDSCCSNCKNENKA